MSNPYESPNFASPVVAPQRPPLPTFVLVVLIVDLLFLCMRALLVLAGIVGIMSPAVAGQPMVAQTGIYEVLAGVIMVVAGFPADIGMLLRQAWGVPLAYVKIIGTLGSIGVGIWQLTFMMDRMPPGTPEFIGLIIGASITIGIRLLLVGLYLWAVLMFASHLKSAPAPPVQW